MASWCCPDRWVDAGNADGAAEIKRHAQRKVVEQLHQLDAELVRGAGPWFLGQAYSALDPYVFTLCRWTRNFSGQRAREFPRLGPYLARMLERPAVQRVLVTEGLQPPYV